MSKQIKISKDKDETDINPFTKQERDVIIETFKIVNTIATTPVCQVLFYTGVDRQAIALQWKHINKFHYFLSKR